MESHGYKTEKKLTQMLANVEKAGGLRFMVKTRKKKTKMGIKVMEMTEEGTLLERLIIHYYNHNIMSI